MYVRKKINPSGIISIQIIDKSSGKYKVLHTIGNSNDLEIVEKLFSDGKLWIQDKIQQLDIFAEHTKQEEEKQVVDYLINNIQNVLFNGTQLIINAVYDSIGFNKVEDKILRQLVIARLTQPLSKLATVDFLKSYFDEDIALHQIYRYMDKLYNKQQDAIQKISIEHTKKVLGGSIGLMFYDVTTLYFETEQKDEFRETGFSKDGKHSNSQIVLGLLVSKDGYPLAYSIFNGSQYEGYTMIPIVDDFVKRYALQDFVVVADSGLMNKTNIKLLESGGYKYIIGARIKAENKEIKKWILSLEKVNGIFHEKTTEGKRLIINYSETRARKDNYNREKGVSRLKKTYKTGKITKENINKKGYNKFLEIADNVGVEINNEKIKEDEKWDGLKGYITNTELTPKEIYAQYNGLWVIEKAFRISKNTLEIRPIFHFTPKRIEAHICICFVAYKVYKEMERLLKVKGFDLSIDKVLSIAKTITTIKVKLPKSGQEVSKILTITQNQKSIKEMLEPNFWLS